MGQQLEEGFVGNGHRPADELHLFRSLHRPQAHQVHILPGGMGQGRCQGTLFRIGKIIPIQGQVVRLRQFGRFRPEPVEMLHQFALRCLLAHLQGITGISDDHRPPGIHIQQAFPAGEPGEIPDGGISLDEDPVHFFLFQKSPKSFQCLHPIVSL